LKEGKLSCRRSESKMMIFGYEIVVVVEVEVKGLVERGKMGRK
jgi:hypothetical protein